MDQVLVNGRVMTDAGLEEGLAVIVEAGRIAAVVPDGGAIGDGRRRDLGGGILLPGFIDLQVNGGGGVLFNDQPTPEAIAAIGAAHRKFGTTGFLPTLISDAPAIVAKAVAAARAASAAGVPGVLGVHIEGPFLNTDRKGIHEAGKLRKPDAPGVDLLTAPGPGKTLVTLAPEVAGTEVVRRLAAAGVIVSAGHTNATYAQTLAALDAGMTGFTHLFNAMSPLSSREPGVVGAALADPRSWCGVIVDGRHVDPVVLRLALRCRPVERFMLVTDAMPCVGSDQTSFTLQNKTIRVRDGACYDARGRLAGSNLDMASAVRNAVGMLGVSLVDASRMASRNPAEFMGLGAELGRIAPGYRADLVLLDEALEAQAVWIGGRAEEIVDGEVLGRRAAGDG